MEGNRVGCHQSPLRFLGDNFPVLHDVNRGAVHPGGLSGHLAGTSECPTNREDMLRQLLLRCHQFHGP